MKIGAIHLTGNPGRETGAAVRWTKECKTQALNLEAGSNSLKSISIEYRYKTGPYVDQRGYLSY